jgi:MFS family permease
MTSAPVPRLRLFYGWWVVIAGALAHAVSTGLGYFGLSAYFPSLEREFGWSRTAISGAFSLARIESGLLGPAEGFLTDRLGPRRVILIGLTLSVSGYLCLSLVNSLPMLYAVIVLGIVLGSSLAFFVPVSVVVARLFRARRGLAFGIFRMGPGLSGALVPLVGWSIVWWGWRRTAFASAFVILAVGLALARIIGRSHADDESADLPDRASLANPPTSQERNQIAGHAAPPEIGFTLKEALNSLAFWMLSIATALRHMVTEGVSVHFVVLLVDRGWSQELAAAMLGISNLISVPSRLGFGWLGDFADKRRLMMGLLMSLGIAVYFMGSAAGTSIFFPAMVIYSLAYGGLASLQESIRADYFGTRYFASIQGFSRLITTAGSFMGPLIAGYLYDLTRSYAVPFAFFAGVSAAATLCMLIGRPPQPDCLSRARTRPTMP